MSDDDNLTFGVVDYVIFASILAVSVGIGVFYACTGKKQSTTREFLTADRSMGVIPVSLSLLASFISATAVLGVPVEIYTFGTLYLWIIVAYVVVMPISAYLFLPVFYELGLTSAYEYLERRFNKWVRLAGSLTFCVQMTFYLALVLYAPALTLNQVTGLNVWVSVFAIGVSCTFYTTIGGMKAVMWTDVFQVVVMLVASLTTLIQGAINEGGVTAVWNTAVEGRRIEWYNFDGDPTVRHTVWSLVIGGVFTWLPIYGVNQAQVQRYLSVPRLRVAQLSLWLNSVGLTLLLLLTSAIGLVVYAKYRLCDPLRSGRVQGADQLFPLFVMDTLKAYTGFPGLFLASVFSATLSTLSSGLNSIAAVVLEDVVRKFFLKNCTDVTATRVSKILVVCFGAVCIALTFVAAELGAILQVVLALFGMIGGPLLGMFVLAMFLPWTNAVGAVAGLLSGLVCTLWCGIGAQVYKPVVPVLPLSTAGCSSSLAANMTTLLTSMTSMAPTTTTAADRPATATFYALSYMWIGLLGVMSACLVGIVVSFLTGATKPSDVDPKLLSPAIRWLFIPRRHVTNHDAKHDALHTVSEEVTRL